MYNTLFLLGLAALSGDLALQEVATDRAVVVDSEGLAVIYSKLQQAIDEERYEDALVWTKAFMAHPDFAGLPEQRQAAVYYLVGALNLQLGRPAAALPSLVRATDSPGSTMERWSLLMDAYVALRDRTGAARTLTVMLGRFPESRSDLYDDFVLQTAGSPELDRDAALELRLALFKSGWSHDQDSWIWMKLVDDLMSRGRGAETGPMIARVTQPSSRMQLFAMRRFDAVRPVDATFEIESAYAAALKADRSRAEAPGATVGDRSTYLSALLARGRYDEALVLADRILAEPVPDAEADPDAESNLTWVMDDRVRILLALGRHDEAIDQARVAALRAEYGRPNVSQTINLGGILLRLERYAEAMEAVATVAEDQVSRYGWMQVLRVRACAALSLADGAAAEPLWGRLDADWREAPGATYAGLACRGDEDGMARLLLEILSDPEKQELGVAYMHQYLDPALVSDFDRRMIERHFRVIARPEVLAARDAVARAFDVPIVKLPI